MNLTTKTFNNLNEGAAFEGKIHMEAKGTPARPSKSQPDNKMAENR